MPKFKDNLDREWSIEITTIDVRELKAKLDVNVSTLFDDPDNLLIVKLCNDLILICDCCELLLADQTKKLGLDERQFAKGLVGDGLQRALECLVEAIAMFFPRERGDVIRQYFKSIQEQQQMAAEKIIKAAGRIAEKSAREIDKRLDDLLN